MTIQYYIGGKIVGLAADTKPTSVPANTTFIESDTFTEFIFDGVATWNQIGAAPPGAVGGWKLAARTILNAPATTIDTVALPDKRYYMFLTDAVNSGGTIQLNHRVGNGSFDAGTNYAHRRSDNGGADATGGNLTEMPMENLTSATPRFAVSLSLSII